MKQNFPNSYKDGFNAAIDKCINIIDQEGERDLEWYQQSLLSKISEDIENLKLL